ncbi:MAG TPA: hypothetical protein VFG50_06015, partial [Rhodothermales bacterium]|nr:hypothetical protein [Rhodothermales bacterium]
RELQLWASVETLDTGFSDVEALAAACRFRDCTHEQEPGCAVREALEAGRIDPGRYRNYVKMRRELEYLERRQQETYEHDERRRGRQGSLLVRQALKRKGR